ncbi:MAG TPA: hypothetical protein PLQ13_09195 [Candidatus Krumholzibacteria bacterium]|nr:hypothetical protein [Candidatus Krumholzibacteria bacterium]
MKNIVTAATLLALVLFSGTALAQLDPDEDGIGVYFDPCACVNCVPMDAGAHVGYVVITHPTAQTAGVGGWEAMIWLEGPAIITNTIYEGSSINFLTPPEYVVGIGTPLYNPFMYPAVVVARLEFLILDASQPINWYINGVYRHSLPERVPCYLDGADYDIIIPLQQPTGGPDIPVATINGECAVDSQPESWGGVKSLFR